jgi:hypothetical protein
VDPVAADAFCCSLLDLAPEDVGHLRAAAAEGLGTLEWSRLRTREV